MAESLIVGRNFVSGVCKLKPKKPIFFQKPRYLPALGATLPSPYAPKAL